MKHPKFTRAFEVVAELPTQLAPLKELAGNFWWTWNHEIRSLFRSIDKELWDASEHNPVLFLNRVSNERWAQLQADRHFISRLNSCADSLRTYLTDKTWFASEYPEQVDRLKIAYFCFEFGITEGLPIYSGGLGVLAGDHLKSASDLGLPLVGMGLLYNRGYFRQKLTHDGWQQEVYPPYDFYQMPLKLQRAESGDPIRVAVDFPDRQVTLQIWRADVGRVPLYLLDSNVLENAPEDQGITDSLYSGDQEMRMRQEMVLGIGGLKALKALGIHPTVCHMNEGHAAFQAIERIRQFMDERNVDFRVARQVTVQGNVFTTHTPVPAGFDLFPVELLERYISKTVQSTGSDFDEFVQLGRFDPSNKSEPFNMAILAMESANYVNGVARLHGEVSREMFASRWPGYPENEVPIDHVTNGIHTLTWVGARMAGLFDQYLGTGWRRNPSDPSNWTGIDSIPDDELWSEIENQRGELVRFVRKRVQGGNELLGTRRHHQHNVVNKVLDPRILTVGFARRFATYKRGSLMIADPERLKSILFHAERPVQIVISGKSHPRDEAGKKIIQDLVRFIQANGLQQRMVFLEDYDMMVARRLVQGVDIWLNNPRRPYEASGTSGMKVVPNGGLNCSILDGWWDEAYAPEVGFVIGDRTNASDSGYQDWLDSRSLYDTLENHVAPVFYHRVDRGLPVGWLRMIRESLKALAPQFSTHRMVQDYVRKFYIPASDGYLNMAADDCAKAKAAREWRQRVRESWEKVAVVEVTDEAALTNFLGSRIRVQARVQLGSLNPGEVRVQVVTGKVGPNREISGSRSINLDFVHKEAGVAVFAGELDCNVPGHQGYTVRVIPHHEDVQIPAELNLVVWQ